MPSLDFATEEKEFHEFYTRHLDGLREASEFFQKLIRKALKDLDGCRVIGRVKERVECLKKFKRKYRAKLEQSNTPYAIQDHITDLIGLRVVCLYEDEIAIIIGLLQNYFSQIEATDKIGSMRASTNVMGYQAYHMDMELNSHRQQLEEYKEFAHLRFEVQIRTVIQDAWSQIDHKIKYKQDLSPELDRRINLLSGLFEIADREFLDVREKSQTFIEQNNQDALKIIANASSEYSPRANNQPSQLTSLELSHFLESIFPKQTNNPFHVERMVAEILGLADVSLQELIGFFAEHQNQITDYEKSQEISFKPLTFVRHLLFLANKERFKQLLFHKQRINFESWIEG
jgi:putative GTP pyrophosphokinase